MSWPIIGITCNFSGNSNATYGNANLTAANKYLGTAISPFGQTYYDRTQAPSSGMSTYYPRQVQPSMCANALISLPPLIGTPTTTLNQGAQSGPGSTTSPVAPDGTVTPTLMTMTDVANGVWDNVYFKPAAQNAASIRPDAYWRPAWEWPGKDWGTWNGPANAEAVKEWYTRFVTLARGYSSNFRFCWDGGREWSTGVMDSLDYYPGDQYVDVITGDYYDDDSLAGQNGWNTGGAAKAQKFLDFARSHGKTFGIPECGVVSTHGDDPRWLSTLIDWAIANRDVVKFVLYFNEQGSSLDNGNNPLTAAKLLERGRALAQKAIGTLPNTGIVDDGTALRVFHH